jgi:hypothetical protein
MLFPVYTKPQYLLINHLLLGSGIFPVLVPKDRQNSISFFF